MAKWVKIKNSYLNVDLIRSITIYKAKQDGKDRICILMHTEQGHIPLRCKEGLTAEEVEDAVMRIFTIKDRELIDLSDLFD